MCHAQQIVDKLRCPDAQCWHTLILGYYANGEPQKALAISFFVQNCAVVRLSDFVLLAQLKASTDLNDLASGIVVHLFLVKQGVLEENRHIASALVDMYTKCGSIIDAQCVFEMLLTKDSVIWTTMMTGLCECKLYEDALQCFEKMQSQSITPDCFSYASSLKACGRLFDLERGHSLHAGIIKRGFEDVDVFISSGLVDMYARCGSFLEANAVLTRSQLQSVVLWAALITAFIKYCRADEAIQSFEMMKEKKISPNVVIFVCILKSCAAGSSIDSGLKIHSELIKRGYEKELNLSNSLIDMYSKCGFVEEARQGFDKVFLRDVVSFNALLAGYASQRYYDEVILVCKLMDSEGVFPNAVTFSIILRVCSITKATIRGQQAHNEIIKTGLLAKEDDHLGNSLVDMYAKCGLLEDAWHVLARLSAQDLVSWTAIMQGYAECSCEEVVLLYLEKMQQANVAPGTVTYICCLRACGFLGSLLKGQQIHKDISEKGLENEPHISNCLIYLYSKCGMLEAAEQILLNLQEQDIMSCNALSTGYAQLGKSEGCFCIFDKMIKANIQPDPVTFVSLLNACSHEGQVANSLMVFEAITEYSGVSPSFNHYACIIDLFGRAGNVDVAIFIITRMPVQPAMVIWHSIMAACRKWGNVDVAEAGFEQTLQIDDKDDSAYLYMFNIYVDAGLYENASQVDYLRQIKRKRLV